MNDFAILQYAKDVMAREAYTIVDAANQLDESFSYAIRLILRQCGIATGKAVADFVFKPDLLWILKTRLLLHTALALSQLLQQLAGR